jgi:AraC-like DNA-binding protein
MRVVNLHAVDPVVRLANNHSVRAGEYWDRSIPDPQLIYILSGSFEFSAAECPTRLLAPGEILFIEPNIQHHFALALDQVSGWITGFHFEFIPESRWAVGDYRLAVQPDRVTRTDDGTYLQERFHQMAVFYESYRPYRQELVNSIAREVILLLAAHWQTETLWSATPGERIEAMLEYIRANLAQPLSRQSLAHTFNLSAGYINQLFQAELGMPPSAVVNRERLARAYQLLDREGLSVAETALSVGYRDPFYFSRVFRQLYMIPPSAVISRRNR